jgi:hypothetical protein
LKWLLYALSHGLFPSEVDSESPAAGGWLIGGFVDHTAASRSSILGTLVAGDIILQIDEEPVLRNIPTKMASSRILFDDDDDSMTLLVYSPSKKEREESADLRDRLIQQDHATTRKDQSHANCRSNRNKDPSHQIPRGAAGYIGKRFVDADEPGELWEITDVYFSFADKEIVIDYNNCDPEKEQARYYSSFREFLLWPGLEVREPECTPDELSEYEKLRKARIDANQEFLRGLGLA